MRTSLKLTRLRQWTGFLTPVLVALGFGLLLRSSWLIEACDGALRSQYYEIARPSTGLADIVLIAADDRSIERFGPPPWTWDRVQPVVDEVLEGSPKAVAIVDRQRVFVGEPDPSDPTATALARGVLQLDLSSGVRAGYLPVTTLDLAPDPSQTLDELFEELDTQSSGQRELPVRYIHPPNRLPTVPLTVVADEELAPQTFTDKIVLIAVTSAQHADRLPTPVGPLTKAEIVAHALAGLSDGRPWWSPSEPSHAAILFGILLLLRGSSRGPRPGRAALLAGGTLAGLVLLDYLLFAHGLALWGVSTALIAGTTVVVATWYERTRNSVTAVQGLCRNAASMAVLGASEPLGDERRQWEELLEFGLLYFGATAPSLIAELMPNDYRLWFRAGHELTPDAVIERRRDIRRPPFRDLLLTHRVRRIPSIVGDETTWTFAVPLVHNSRLVGAWFVERPKDLELAANDEQRLLAIGAAMGSRIARSQAQNDDKQAVADAAALPFSSQVQIVERSLHSAHRDQMRVIRLFERLPIGFLVADMWGHIIHVNSLMLERLADDFPDGVPNGDLRAVVARTTGGTLEEAQDLVRSALNSKVDIHFTARLDVDNALGERPSFILTRVDLGEDPADLDTRHLLLIARPDFDDAANRMFRTA